MDQAATCDGDFAGEGRCAVDLFGMSQNACFVMQKKASINHVGEVVPDHACEMISYPPIGSSTFFPFPCNQSRVYF